MGVNTNVNSDKVLTLVDEQQKQIDVLKKDVAAIDKRISKLRQAHELVNELVNDIVKETTPMQTNEQERQAKNNMNKDITL